MIKLININKIIIYIFIYTFVEKQVEYRLPHFNLSTLQSNSNTTLKGWVDKDKMVQPSPSRCLSI